MPLRRPSLPEGKAWLLGEHVDRFKLLYNQRVQVIGGPDAGAVGWIVAVDPNSQPEPVYTVEIENGDPNAELPESALQPAGSPVP